MGVASRRRGVWFLSLVATLGVPVLGSCRQGAPPPRRDLLAELSLADFSFDAGGRSLLTDFSDPALVEGWSEPETAPDGGIGVWTMRERSRVRFHLNALRPLRLRIVATPFRYPGRPRPRLSVSVNGAPLQDLTFSDGPMEEHEIPVAAGLLRAGSNEIVFLHPWARSPRQVGTGPDPRPLAVYFTCLALVGPDDATPASCRRPRRPSPSPPELLPATGTVFESTPEGRSLRVTSGVSLLGFDAPPSERGLRLRGTVVVESPARDLAWAVNDFVLLRQSYPAGRHGVELEIPNGLLRDGRNTLALRSDGPANLEGPTLETLPAPGAIPHPSGALLDTVDGRVFQPGGTELRWVLRVRGRARLEIALEAPGPVPIAVLQGDPDGARARVLFAGTVRGQRTLALEMPPEADDRHFLSLRAGVAGGGPGVHYRRLEVLGDAVLPARPAPPARAAQAPSARAPRTILLYVVDALRPDRLSVYGYGRPTSPRLAAFASQAERFTEAWATSSWTKAATASILTGRLPHDHGADRTLSPMRGDVAFLPERLKGAGYRTIALTANSYIHRAYGFARGFDSFENFAEKSRALHGRLERLLREAGPRAPLFVYVHTMEPHWPYLPRRPWNRFGERPRCEEAAERRVIEGLKFLLPYDAAPPEAVRRLSDCYDGAVSEADAAFGVTLDLLERNGRRDDALVLFVSDHGQEFGEHGGLEHGQTLFDEVLRVPLLVRWPDGTGAGRVSARRTSQIDLAPTMLAACGLDASDLPGRPLSAEPAPMVEAQLDLSGLREVRLDDGKWTYHRIDRRAGAPQHAGRPLEHLVPSSASPGERLDRPGDRPWEGAHYRALSRPPAGPVRAPAEAVIDVEAIERLRALGYIR